MFQYFGVIVLMDNNLIKLWVIGLTFLVASCGSEPKFYPPDIKALGSLGTIEFASLDKRIIQIEVRSNIIETGLGERIQKSSKIAGMSFVLFDFCREQNIEWKMLSLKQSDITVPKWSYVLTHFKDKQENGQWKTKNVSRGGLKGDLITYNQLRGAGLTYFEKGLIKCETTTFLLDSSKKVKVPAHLKNRKRKSKSN